MAADGQQIARQAAARPVAEIHFQGDAAHTQLGPHQRVGEMERRQVVVIVGQVVGPRLVETDHDGRA